MWASDLERSRYQPPIHQLIYVDLLQVIVKL